MDLTNLQYCYLNRVYVDSNDVSQLYEFTLSDSYFLNVCTYITDLEGLRKLAENESLSKDFSLDAGFLKCDNVPRVENNNLVKEAIGIPSYVRDLEYSFYTFVQTAVEHDFLIVDDSILDCERFNGIKVSNFKNIRFSQSTMSVYFPLVNEEGLRNKHLVLLEDGLLRLNVFHFAVPAEYNNQFKENGCVYCSRMFINNSEYVIYRMDELPIYPYAYVTAGNVINKAVSVRERSKAIVEVVTDYISFCNGVLGNNDNSKLPWAGGNNSYSSGYGVTLTSSLTLLKRTDRSAILDRVLGEIFPEMDSYTAAVEYIKNGGGSQLAKACLNVLSFICFSGKNVTEQLAYAVAVKNKYKTEMFYADLFLYQVRVATYVRRIHLANPINPVLQGSDEAAYTIVNEGFYYGDV